MAALACLHGRFHMTSGREERLANAKIPHDLLLFPLRSAGGKLRFAPFGLGGQRLKAQPQIPEKTQRLQGRKPVTQITGSQPIGATTLANNIERRGGWRTRGTAALGMKGQSANPPLSRKRSSMCRLDEPPIGVR